MTPTDESGKHPFADVEGQGREALRALISDTTDETFAQAGGFGFVDEIAVHLDAKWRGKPGPMVLSGMDLAWLIDGYARARFAALAPSPSEEQA
jgi:hypothetical protein